MQKTFAEIIEAMGGKVLGKAGADGAQGDRAGRLHHPRGRRRDHGRRPEDVGRATSGARRWDVKNLFLTDGAPFAVERRQESDADDHGAGVAHGGLHAGRDEAAGAVT